MSNNTSTTGGVVLRQANHRLLIVQILVIIFLSINMLLIVTFFRTKSLHSTARYILFALMLVSDSFYLLLSDILLVLAYFEVSMQVRLCVIIAILAIVYNFVTPVTLAAMTLERYVAICMPFRHTDLCSTRRTVHCVLVIHVVSSVVCVVRLPAFFSVAPAGFFDRDMFCLVEMFVVYAWHNHLRSAVSQFYFLFLFIIIVFLYIKIMKVAKAASGENKKSSQKGLRTVSLHGFQLLLSLVHLWCPFIEAAVFQIDYNLFITLRYANYIMFILAPRCLSPLIYGLRDETFFLSIKKLFCPRLPLPREKK